MKTFPQVNLLITVCCSLIRTPPMGVVGLLLMGVLNKRPKMAQASEPASQPASQLASQLVGLKRLRALLIQWRQINGANAWSEL